MIRLVLALLLLVAPTYALAQGLPSSCQASGGLSSLSFVQVTVSSTAVSLTVPADAKCAIIVVESQPVRYRDDGTAPTSTVGVPVPTGGSVAVGANQLRQIQFIRASTATGDATLNVSWYKT